MWDNKSEFIVDNNPLKYIDPTGHVKVYPMDGGEPHELDVLTSDEGSTTIGVVVLITEGLGFVVQL
jgi:protein associated with RNAse G/E